MVLVVGEKQKKLETTGTRMRLRQRTTTLPQRPMTATRQCRRHDEGSMRTTRPLGHHLQPYHTTGNTRSWGRELTGFGRATGILRSCNLWSWPEGRGRAAWSLEVLCLQVFFEFPGSNSGGGGGWRWLLCGFTWLANETSDWKSGRCGSATGFVCA